MGLRFTKLKVRRMQNIIEKYCFAVFEILRYRFGWGVSKNSSNQNVLYMVRHGIYQSMKIYYRLFRRLLAPGQGGRGTKKAREIFVNIYIKSQTSL